MRKASAIFRRSRTRGDGSTYRERNWTLRYRDGAGRVRTEAAFASKAKSRALLADRLRQAGDGVVDFYDPRAQRRRQPMAEHLDDFANAMDAASRAHRQAVVSMVRRGLAAMGIGYPGELTRRKLRAYLVQMVEGPAGERRAYATRNYVLQAFRRFVRWGIKERLWAVDATADIAMLRVKHDPGYGARRRRALTVEEFNRLCDAAERRPVENWVRIHTNSPMRTRLRMRLIGQERATLYRVAATTGLRKSELRALCWGDVALRGELPYLIVRVATSKAGREDVPLPLLPATADALRRWRRGWAERNMRPPRNLEPVFECVSKNFTKLLRKDAAFATPPIPVLTRDGKLDLHALRTTFCTAMARAGVPLAHAQAMMRHADPRMTVEVYTRVLTEDKLAAARRLGAYMSPSPGSARAADGGA